MDRFSERGNPDFYWWPNWFETAATAVRTMNGRLFVRMLGAFSWNEMDIHLRAFGFTMSYARQAFVREIHGLVVHASEDGRHG